MSELNTTIKKAFIGSIIILGVSIILNFFNDQLSFIHPRILPLSLFYFVLNCGVFMVLFLKKDINKGEGVLTYIIIMTVRIVLSLGFLVLFLYFRRSEFDKLFVLNFFVTYLLYTWFEVKPFIPNLRGIS